MIIETVEIYNNRKTAQWHDDCDKWQPGKGGMPQLVMYLFDKKYGYVASGGRAAIWRRTKEQATRDFIKSYGTEGLK
jgi:hypothetical protein